MSLKTQGNSRILPSILDRVQLVSKRLETANR